jgi:hypothetical protein
MCLDTSILAKSIIDWTEYLNICNDIAIYFLFMRARPGDQWRRLVWQTLGMSPHPGSGPHQNTVVGEEVTHEEVAVVAPSSLASNSTASRAAPPNPRKSGPPPHHGLKRNKEERGGEWERIGFGVSSQTRFLEASLPPATPSYRECTRPRLLDRHKRAAWEGRTEMTCEMSILPLVGLRNH